MSVASTALAGAFHHVHFPQTDETLIGVVTDYLSVPLLAGGAAVVVATPAHRDRVWSALAAAGVDVEQAVRDGRLRLHDAAKTLRLFVADGRLEPARFEAVVGGLFRGTAGVGRPLRVYAELVALLWAAGQVDQAIELELLWNELSNRMTFELLCSYPVGLFDDATGAEAFNHVCDQHGEVIDGAPVSTDVDAWRRFPQSTQTARLARRFVRKTLQGWGHDQVDLALLVVSELATNAVVHARSDVSVGIARRPGGVRLVVGDTSSVPPVHRADDVRALNGRGVRMIAGLADGWGHEVVDGGKLVWVELNTQPS